MILAIPIHWGCTRLDMGTVALAHLLLQTPKVPALQMFLSKTGWFSIALPLQCLQTCFMRCVLPCYTFFWGLDYVDAMSLELSFHQRKTWQLNVHCKDVLICKSWRFCTFWSFAMWDAKAINGWTMVLNHKHDSSSKLQPTHWIHRPPPLPVLSSSIGAALWW